MATRYTIKGKEYTEFDINKRCAKIMGLRLNTPLGRASSYVHSEGLGWEYDPCNNPYDTWPIIEKIWDKLNGASECSAEPSVWAYYVDKYKCTKLIAACICFIEENS